MKTVIIAAALTCAVSGAVQAATKTFEATMTGVTGSAALLAEMGIASGGTLTARFTFDTNMSGADYTYSSSAYSYDQAYDTYDDFSLTGPGKTVDSVASDGANHRVYTQDGLSDGTVNIYDTFQVGSFLYSTDESAYYYMYLSTYDYDETKWDRSQEITADILNSFSSDHFSFAKYIGGSQTTISATSITYAEVSAVPLPATGALLLGAVGLLGWRRGNRAA